MDKTEIIDQIKKLVPIFSRVVNINYLVLFGSYSKGTNHKNSDIDVAIVSDNLPKGILSDEVSLALVEMHKINMDFEPHFYRTEKWENPTKDSFIDYIKKYGEVIYSNGHE